MTSIPVRYGKEILIFMNLTFLFCFLASYENPHKWGLITLLITVIFANYVLLGIKYSIDDQNLYIKNSIFGTTTISIKDIKAIKKTGNILSAPAPSIFGRVAISSTFHDTVISPLHYEEFKQMLLSRNPKIEFTD